MAPKPPPKPPDGRRPTPPPLPPDARRPTPPPLPPPPPVEAADDAEDTNPDNPPLPPLEYPPPPELVAPWHETAQQPPKAPTKSPRKPPREPPGTGVEVTNRSDGGFFYWLLRFYAFGLMCAFGLLLMAGFGTYIYFAATLPTLPDIATYHEVAATTTVMRGADGTPLAELAAERREILAFEKFPTPLVQAFLAAEDRRFYEHEGIDYRGIGARVDREPARRRGRPGRLDHHAAGGEVVPVDGADAAAEDPRGDPGAAPGTALHQARHPDAVPQPDLPRPRLVRRRGGGAALLRQGGGRSRSRRDGAARRPGPGAVALLAAHQPRGRPGAPRSGAGHDDRRRLPERRRRQPLARPPRRRSPAPGFLPHDVALLRRARAPRHRPPLRREEAARGRPRHRDLGGAVDRRLGAGERRLLAAQAGQAAGVARSGGAAGGRGGRRVPRAASRPATAPIRPRKGASTSASSRARRRAAPTAYASARASTRCRPPE